MKKIFLIILTTVSSLIIMLHAQTIPFILLVIIATLLGITYYKQEKAKQRLINSLVLEKDIATIQLKAVSEEQNESSFLYTAFMGMQKAIIKKEIDKSVKPNIIRISLPLFNETRYVNINDIIRCEAENSYTKFFLSNGEEIMVTKTLKDFSDFLINYCFVRTHQSHLINTNFIKSWVKDDGGFLLLTEGNRIPISRANREKVKEKLEQDFKNMKYD